jgi:anti-sigma regulatory factor (Ser/Thr protein kinase)
LDIAPVDFDHDSTDELLMLKSDTVVELAAQNLSVLSGTVYLPHPLSELRELHVGGSDPSHLCACYVRRDSLFLFLAGGREVLVVAGRDSHFPKGWDGSGMPVLVGDINADSQLEVVVSVGAGFDQKPRGLYAFDWESGRRLWCFTCGPYVTSILARDLDGDGRTELVCGTFAAGNGNEDNGTNDGTSYVLALNSDGSLRWLTPIGRYSSRTETSWLESNRAGGLRLVVCEVGNPAGDRKCDSMFVLDAASGAVLTKAQYGDFNSGHVVLRVAGGRQLVAVGGVDDTLRILDDQLAMIRKACLHGSGAARPALILARALVSDGRHLLVPTTDGRLLLYDVGLRLISARRCLCNAMLPVRLQGGARVLLRVQRGSTASWQLMDLAPPVLEQGVALWKVIAGALGMLIVFSAAFLLYRYARTKDMRTVVRGLTGRAGVVEIDRAGRLRHVNAKGRELLHAAGASMEVPLPGPLGLLAGASQIDSVPRELPIPTCGGQTILARATPIRSGVLLTLEDISAVEYMKRVMSWAPVAQRLAHDIKNPLTAMSLALQRVEKSAGPDSGRYVESMKEDIERLKKMADGFMRLTKLDPPKLEPSDFNDVVRQCLAKFEGAVPVGVSIKTNLADGLPLSALDRQQVVSACGNVIENAIAAMTGKGGVLSVTTRREGDRVVAVVTDTGKGIPERYLNKVFEPYFTMKPGGTGLGMCITKRIIEDHKGSIAIRSKEGEGTTVTITLPVAPSA